MRILGHIPVLSRALRWYAGRYKEGTVVTILSGHAAGMRWRRFHRYVNGYWLGHYELPVQNVLVNALQPGDAFYDVGANAGLLTLVAARKVGPTGRCFAFDPDPDNVASIRAQIELNDLKNIVVVQAAVSDSTGNMRFVRSAPGSPMGHLAQEPLQESISTPEESFEVNAMTLDEAVRQYGPPKLIKMDIEGAEAQAIAGAGGLLARSRPVWLIELHNKECELAVRKALEKHGYQISRLSGESSDPAGAFPYHILARPGYG